MERAEDEFRRHPHWEYGEPAGVGHPPQLQVPDQLAGHPLDWLPRAVSAG